MPRKYFKATEFFGFGSLIILIATIGIIGIFQIKYLSNIIESLGTQHLRLQRAALEMRISNSLYGRHIRDSVFWRTSKLLEAVPRALNPKAQQKAVENFNRHFYVYASSIPAFSQQSLWAKRLKENVFELRVLGDEITQKMQADTSKSVFKDFSKLLMTFENSLYEIDEFLSDTVEKNILHGIEQRLDNVRTQRRNAIFLLSLCLSSCIALGGFIAWGVYTHNRSEEEKKRELLSQMLRIEDQERKKLSLQVHNEMGQDLSALKIYLKLKDFAQCLKLMDTLSEKAHNISYLLRPPVLAEIGIVSALEALILQYRQMTGLNYVYNKPQQEIKIPSEYTLILYQVAQEILNNAVKYAKAQNIKLDLQQAKAMVKLDIEDDGVGFDYKRFLEEGPKDKLGLLGLRERIELFGGRMRIETAAGKGTRINVELGC